MLFFLASDCNEVSQPTEMVVKIISKFIKKKKLLCFSCSYIEREVFALVFLNFVRLIDVHRKNN